MVSWNETETELLLKLVQEREALYDVANEDYTNRDIVWALWTDIARQLNKTPTACRDKWTSLRCVYRRIINQQANSNKKKKIKWPWAHMMTFLIPHLKTIQPRYGPDVEIDDTDSVITINDYKSFTSNGNNYMTYNNLTEEFEMCEGIPNSEDGIAEYLYYESEAESEQGDEHTENKNSLKKIKLDNASQAKPIEFQKSGADSNNEYVLPSQTCCHHYDQLAGADPDEMFFRSIIPDVKLLNQKDKGIFKLKVQQLLHDMIYSSKDEEVKTTAN
ncbi:hypothetical protein L9F63_012493 [Diploptera punctata]|uniref:Transcription factor Adf-1 n=1 Tax=Diploptera punctata TaxID=6984 RepID=A0AAD8EMS6_DIPPU|nr:hypothetical protein L9F63_012493 [Diploptera punctata]